ncbi:hypothetical protein GGR56DRAFT_673253 [Xylariaceae sp. FL0804]|nr:hypothetical protein GGR56DRAFT_673253 [Xylariaceae sp. FL0804]
MGDEKRPSSWIRFKTPGSEPLEPSTFTPLFTADHGRASPVHDVYYSRIKECPEEGIVVVIWEPDQSYGGATSSDQYREFLAKLGALSDGSTPTATAIDFNKIAFWWRWTPNTELRTVYFPAPVLAETRRAVDAIRPLVLSMGRGIGGSQAHLCPYNGVPTHGWGEDILMSEGREAVACTWIHYWKDESAEEKYKTTERRPPKDGESNRPLAIEAFERDLTDLGALAWDDVHVDFQKVRKLV